MIRIFTLPGLGFDSRIFSNIDFGGADVRHLEWVEPLSVDEPIGAYAGRMAASLGPPARDVVLIGHSFGGVMAQEIARHVPVDKIILVSSVKSRRELPLWFRAVEILGVHRIFYKKLILSSFPLWARLGGYTSPEDRALFRSMIARQSDTCLQWSLRAIARWRPAAPPACPVVHLHGTGDQTFPVGLIEPPFLEVDTGNHFMVFNRPTDTGNLILQALHALRALRALQD
jgi:pimeloyl-ACP methyl ester carboxylesterase